MTTTDNTARKLAEDALRLAERATKGPWIRSTHGFQVINRESSFSVVEQDLTDRLNNTRREQAVLIGNAQFVAESRQLVPDLATALLTALDRIEQLERVEQAARAFVVANKAQHENGAWVIGEKSRLQNELYHAGVDVLEIYWKVDRIGLDDKLIDAAKTALEDLERLVGE